MPRSRGDRSIVLLDVLQVCLFFSFYTVLQFALGHSLSRASARAQTFRKELKDKIQVQFSEDTVTGQLQANTSGPSLSTSWKERSQAVGPVTSCLMKADGRFMFDDEDLDRISRILYLPIFIVVVIIVRHG